MDDNIRSQMRKGIVEYCVLLLLSQGTSYSSEILARLKEAHLIVVEGTLYPLLTRLKNSGYLQYSWQESTEGPPRKYYSLTVEGRKLLQTLETAWSEISLTVSKLQHEHLQRYQPQEPQSEPQDENFDSN